MKKATIIAKGASVKQWSDLMLELNLMKNHGIVMVSK